MSATKALIEQYQQDRRTQHITNHATTLADVRLHLDGLVGSMEAIVAAAVYASAPQTHVFVLDNKENAAYFHNDLQQLLGNKKDILFFPDSFKKSNELDQIDKNNVLLRTETLSKLLNSNTSGELLVTYPEALYEKVANSPALKKSAILIKIGEILDSDFVIDMLVTYGFEHADFVYEPGQFSIRGGIIDIYSFGNDLPYRIELIGNEVESMRTFDPLTQLSVKKIAQISIVPNIQTQFSASEKTSLFRLLPTNAIVWLRDLNGTLLLNPDYLDKVDQHRQIIAEQQLPDESGLFTADISAAFLDAPTLLADILEFALIEFGRTSYFPNPQIIRYHAQPQPSFNKNFNLLVTDLQNNTKKGIDNLLFAGNAKQIERFYHIFTDLNADINYTPIAAAISEGFIDLDLKVACYTDHQIFNRYYKYNIKQGFSKDKALSIRLLNQLQAGDYVTHIDHGVGVFAGLVKIDNNGKPQEAMKIVYRDQDVLYVGINSLHKVSKYIGKEGSPPKINKLGSDAWTNLKSKTKRIIKVIAFDLIQLYAKRKATKGFAYSPDTYLQNELEASFIYEDTPDQIKATADIKVDMESPSPMDRLICGDVGFGKTEIAVRAAAKAAADSKQVAVLVPTTILAMQHFKTFSDRLKDFPCKIDYLNRFKTTKERNETLKKMETGEVDIVIGTHAILSDKVKFKNLGLLIVDEEQKFGVGAKEKLRNLKISIDTLTLTATPIPRTLQFSLMNARDLSVINTPPPNRQPIQTELMVFDESKIRDYINFEIYRGGQVFFVHNRVKDLPEIANMIMRLCPDISVGMAHGQLGNDDLEDRMMKFIQGKYDVLVCTNIVEAGLDVPNANTIIINNAHHFGLSDLHQLRGRVGRSNKRAFCYLISPPSYLLPDDSRRRLRAIEQFSELGSGFQIAMRDLDIRGAGNLLGGEQSGFIADIGYDTFHKILDEAIRELKESDFKEVFADEFKQNTQQFVRDCLIETDLETLIPDEYIHNVSERLSLYTELDNLETEEALQAFGNRLQDRFGKLPRQVRELFDAVRLRWVAKKIGFERISLKTNKLRCYFIENQSSPYYETDTFAKVLHYVQTHPQKARFKQTPNSLILVFEHIKSLHTALILLQEVLQFAQPEEEKKP